MAKQMHIKGRILQMLQSGNPVWDYEIADRIIREYGYPDGEYWHGTIRMTLTDLFSTGLIEPSEEKIDTEKSHGKEKLLFRFVLTEFGLERMTDTKLTTKNKEVA
jgi:DNA-binding PadR family transcriptional regulator